MFSSSAVFKIYFPAKPLSYSLWYQDSLSELLRVWHKQLDHWRCKDWKHPGKEMEGIIRFKPLSVLKSKGRRPLGVKKLRWLHLCVWEMQWRWWCAKSFLLGGGGQWWLSQGLAWEWHWVFSVYPPTNIPLFISQQHQRDHGQWMTARQQSSCWGLLALGKPGPVWDHTGRWHHDPSPVWPVLLR